MATYYVYSGATGTADGLSWVNAFTTLAAAITAATTTGDVIKVEKTHVDILAADTTYTFANNVAVICVDKDNADALAEQDGTSYYVGHSISARFINFGGAYKCYVRGLAFREGGSSSTNISIARTDGAHHVFEKCRFDLGGGTTQLNFGTSNTWNTYGELRDCTIKFGNVLQSIGSSSGVVRMYGCTIDPASTAVPNNLVYAPGYSGGPFYAEGCDFSYITTTLVPSSSTADFQALFVNCKLGAGVTPLATQTPANLSSAELWLYNCASGDTHYAIGHYNALGSTTVSGSVYCNDNPTYDGTNKCSWVVASTANASFYTPYASPWIDKYHSGTSAITPYLEVLRDGSTTAYQADEVWAEFSYQGTSGSPLAKFASDRMTPLGTPADQAASSKTAADWTGESATAWLGKLDSGAAITPAEIGHLRARVCIGEPSTTLYVDPQIRGVA